MKKAAVWFLILFVISEGAARFFFPSLLGSLYQQDETLGLIPMPNGRGHVFSPRLYGFHFSHDEIGFRENGNEVKAQKAWLFLGDSMVYGVGVENRETFPSQAEFILRDTRVLNAGAPGRGPAYYLNYLRKSRPSGVSKVVVFFTGYNDWKDSYSSPTPQRRRLFRIAGVFERALEIVRGGYAQYLARKENLPNPSEDQYQAGKSLLSSIAKEPGVVFFYLPSMDDVKGDREGKLTSVRLAYKSAMGEIGASFTDLTGALSLTPHNTDSLFLPEDGHYSPLGNNLIARKLVESMEGEQPAPVLLSSSTH